MHDGDMTHPLALALLTGTLGSVIGLVGLFAVFWLTTRHDRRMDAERRDREKEADAVEERAAALGRLLSAIWLQPRDLGWAPLIVNNRAILELHDAVTQLSL